MDKDLIARLGRERRLTEFLLRKAELQCQFDMTPNEALFICLHEFPPMDKEETREL